MSEQATVRPWALAGFLTSLLFLLTYSGFTDVYTTDTPLTALYYPALFLGVSWVLLVKSDLCVPREQVWLGALLVLLAAAYLVGSASIPGGIRYASPPALFLVITFVSLVMIQASMVSTGSLVWALWVAFSIPVAVAVLDQILNLVFDLGYFSGDVQRLIGWAGNPNRLASLCAISALVSFWLAGVARFHRGVYLIMGVLALLALILTGSRAGLLATLAALFGMLLFSPKIPVAIKAGIAILSIVTFLAGYLSVLDSAFPLWERSSSNEQRIEFYIAGFSVLAGADINQFLFGHGYGAFMEKVGHSSHSSYIRLMVDHGVIVSALLLLLVVWIIFLSLVSRTAISSLVGGGIIFLLVDSIFSTGLFSVRAETVFFLFLLVVGTASVRARTVQMI